jgi:hypothetical protein
LDAVVETTTTITEDRGIWMRDFFKMLVDVRCGELEQANIVRRSFERLGFVIPDASNALDRQSRVTT